MNIVEGLYNGLLVYGAEWVLLLLILLSVVVLAVGVERWIYYRRQTGDIRELAAALESYLRNETENETPNWPKGKKSLAAKVAEAGLAMADEGENAADQAMQSKLALERDLLENRLAIVGTIGNNAPFVGLLGTVIGIVHAFDELGRMAAEGQQQSATVMAGIAEALVATAVGLMVAIPAVAVYNYFYRKMASLIASAEILRRILLAHISIRGSDAPKEPEGERKEESYRLALEECENLKTISITEVV